MWYSKQYCLSAVDPVPENVVHCYHRKCTQILTCAHAQNYTARFEASLIFPLWTLNSDLNGMAW